MRVAVTGTTGRIGTALARHLAADHEVICLPRTVFDLAEPESISAVLAKLSCDVFINPAGITSVDACEDDPRLAMRVNSAAPGKIALWAACRGVKMIHFSTDYVFGGETTMSLAEEMAARPINTYGRSKLAGEQAVLMHPGNLVLRVSWVFGPEKPSFVDQVFDAALAGRPLSAVSDKYSLPTFTTDLCHWVSGLIAADASGLVHACNPGVAVSWHGLGSAVVREMTACGLLEHCPEIIEQSLVEMNALRAVRPRFTAMDTARLSSILGGALRPWPEAVTEYVRARCGGRGDRH
jgi:dTDP-4-dehydrorhamnose reductase